MEGEKRRLGLVAAETAEEYSVRRRKEREEFKRERARIERGMIEEQREREAAGLERVQDADQIPVSCLYCHG